jgi:predicted AAA+ superfamily ATPase
MEDRILTAIREKLADSLTMEFPAMTRREAVLPRIPGKAHAVVGMRRAGKTWFLLQCLADRLAAGAARERLVYFNFEDERLEGLQSEHLGLVLEEYYRQFPDFRRNGTVTFCLDEIQLVPGWERFARRVMDSEMVEVFLSGSSARMLSREVATSMRGRAVETLIAPFSFREFLHHREVPLPGRLVSARQRSKLVSAFDGYLATGGFPEALSLSSSRDRVRLLQGYVDAVLFRDVAERHGVGNLVALRAFVRQLLRNPAGSLSVSKISSDFHSRGIPASKETLLAFLDHLQDAFLVFAVPIFSRSERRRQVNPRKLYLADHALAAAFSPAEGLDRGHLLENIVACELVRTSREISYYKTREGFEVDFLATSYDGSERLIQVCADLSDAATRNRELRALECAHQERPAAIPLLLCGEEPPPGTKSGLRIEPLWKWLATQPNSSNA